MFDLAVVVPTVLRPNLVRACRSVIEQGIDGSINLMIGVDHPLGGRATLDVARRLATPRRSVTVIDPGYSTASFRGGAFPCRSGGALRTALSFLGNARYLAFLDDDNWFAPNHLETLVAAIQGQAWAFSLRYFCDSRTAKPLGIDQWESTGPGRGMHRKRFGGFCDTSTLLLDSAACLDVLPHWSYGVAIDGSGVDRRIFQYLRTRPYGATGLATMYYAMQHTDINHRARLRWLEQAGARPSQPMPFAEAARRLREQAGDGAGAPSPAGPAALPAEDAAALAALLDELKPEGVLVAGVGAPSLAEMFRRAAPDATLLALDTLGPDRDAALRYLREHEVLADLSYVGGFEAAALPALLAALWGVTKRPGTLLVSLGEIGDRAPIVAAIERFAFERAAPVVPLGAGHLALSRY